MAICSSAESILEAAALIKANGGKVDAFTNGTDTQTVQLGTGRPTPCLRKFIADAQAAVDAYIGDGVPALLSETDPSVNPERLLEAIEEANEKGTYVCIPSGTFVFHEPVRLPQGDMGNSGYGYDVHLVGAVDQFTIGLNRKYQENDTTFHVEHYGTVLVYDGTDAMFYEKKNFVVLKNISFRNENVSNSSLHTYIQQALFMKRYDAQDAQDRSRVQAEGCNFLGWAGCFGDLSVNERICLYAEWCRFTANTYAVGNIHDGRVVECSFNGGTNAFIFSGDVISGGSTIANNSIEWTSGDGVLINSSRAHMITINGNEFDRCGGCAVKATGGDDISIKNNTMRRSGALQANADSHHLFFENVNGLSIAGNETGYARIQDTEQAEFRPNLCYHIDSSCTNVKMQANDWSGCGDGTQLGTKIARYMSLEPGQVKTFMPYGRYGVLVFMSLSGAARSGLAFYALSSESSEIPPSGSKLAGGDSFIVLSNSNLPLTSHSYSGEIVVSATSTGIQVWNTNDEDIACNIFQIS